MTKNTLFKNPLYKIDDSLIIDILYRDKIKKDSKEWNNISLSKEEKNDFITYLLLNGLSKKKDIKNHFNDINSIIYYENYDRWGFLGDSMYWFIENFIPSEFKFNEDVFISFFEISIWKKRYNLAIINTALTFEQSFTQRLLNIIKKLNIKFEYSFKDFDIQNNKDLKIISSIYYKLKAEDSERTADISELSFVDKLDLFRLIKNDRKWVYFFSTISQMNSIFKESFIKENKDFMPLNYSGEINKHIYKFFHEFRELRNLAAHNNDALFNRKNIKRIHNIIYKKEMNKLKHDIFDIPRFHSIINSNLHMDNQYWNIIKIETSYIMYFKNLSKSKIEKEDYITPFLGKELNNTYQIRKYVYDSNEVSINKEILKRFNKLVDMKSQMLSAYQSVFKHDSNDWKKDIYNYIWDYI